MRKWLTSLGYTLVLLMALFLVLPLLLGLLAENKCKQMVEIINATTPLNAKIISYERGWFSAKATAQISWDKLAIPNKELYQLTIAADIMHGPVLIDWAKFYFVQAMINADIKLNATQNALLKRNGDTSPMAAIKIKFKPNGTTDIKLNSPPLTYQNQENNINWRGLKIRSVFAPLYNKVDSKIDFSGMDIKTQDSNYHLGEITSTYQGNKTPAGIWLGERDLKLASFAITSTNNRIISCDNLNIHSLITSSEKNFANIAIFSSINNININGANYHQNKLDLEINKIAQSLLTKLQQLISNKITSSPTSIGLDTLIAIVNNGSEINIKQLATSTPWGKLFTNIKIAFANQPNNLGLFATIASSVINTNIKTERALALHLLEKLYQNIPATTPNDPEKKAETLLASWQQSGKVLTTKNDPYLHLVIDYKNSQILLNDKQLVITTKP